MHRISPCSLAAFAALCLFGSLTPAHADIDMALNTSNFVAGQPSTLSVDGIITDGGDSFSILAGCIELRFDPAKVTISNLHADSATTWTVMASNMDHTADGWLRVIVYNTCDYGQTEDGPMLLFTVTPVDSTVDVNDCDTLRMSAEDSDLCDTACYDYQPTDACAPMTPVITPPDTPQRGGGTMGPMDSSGGCDPDMATTAAALRYAGGLDTIPPESIADLDSDNDGVITVLDAVRVLRRPCPPSISAAPWAWNSQTSSGCPYPSILVTWSYTCTVPVQFEVQRMAAESSVWLPVGTVAGTAGAHSYQCPDLFLTGAKQYSYHVRTVFNPGTPSAIHGAFSPSAAAVTGSDPNWDDVTGPLAETDPRSWVPQLNGPDATDEAEADMPIGDYHLFWQTGVYDDETGAMSTIPFDPYEYEPSSGSPAGMPLIPDIAAGGGSARPLTFTHDNREAANRFQSPYSAICKIVARYDNGDIISGTGTIVDPTRRFVLTAGHCVARKRNGRSEVPYALWVLPGAYTDPGMAYLQGGPPYDHSGKFASYGVAHVAKRWYFNKYNTRFDQRDDIAVLKLGGGNYAFNAGALFVNGYVGTEQNIGKAFTMAGYPYEDDGTGGWTMYNGTGRTSSWYSPGYNYGRYIVTTDLDANGGDSGGPLWNSERDGTDSIFAVMTMLGARGRQTGSDSKAVVLNPEKCTWIGQLFSK